MKIHGIVKTTLVDYPGKVATTIFTGGCNFRCPYCHNPTLVNGEEETIPKQGFYDFLEERRKLIDAVCITGGEPTLQPGLEQLINKIKEKGYLVKLDTNGSKPKQLKKLIKKLDYVAMDIKAPKEKYQEVTNSNIDPKKIQQSIEIIKNSGVDYEFRTTVVPGLLSKQDIEKIGQWLKGSKRYYLQQFRPGNTLEPSYQEVTPYTNEELKEMKKKIQKNFDTCEVRF